MNLSSSIRALSLLLFCGPFTCAAECAPVEIVVSTVRDAASGRYRTLIENETKKGGSFSPKRIVKWAFQGRSGEFLLAEVSGKRSKACVVYLLQGNQFLSLGGSDRCVRADDPKLMWSENKAWLEFPRTTRQPSEMPTAINEFTAHFDKSTGNVCVLGLPAVGYDAVRCPDDEAPDSR